MIQFYFRNWVLINWSLYLASISEVGISGSSICENHGQYCSVLNISWYVCLVSWRCRCTMKPAGTCVVKKSVCPGRRIFWFGSRYHLAPENVRDWKLKDNFILIGLVQKQKRLTNSDDGGSMIRNIDFDIWFWDDELRECVSQDAILSGRAMVT